MIPIKVRISGPLLQSVKARLLCKNLRRTVEMDMDRSQVQMVVGRKQTMRLCAGLCKQVFACVKHARSADADDNDSPKLEGMHEDEEIDEELGPNIDFRKLLIDKCKVLLKPIAKRHNVAWGSVELVIASMQPRQLAQALEDPDGFFELLAASARSWRLRCLTRRRSCSRLGVRQVQRERSSGCCWC
jgi:hypothetical protein